MLSCARARTWTRTNTSWPPRGEDPQFALALSRLGEVQAELGFEADSERSSRQAVELAESQNLPLPVKYLINASHAQIIDDKKKAIESYENLSKSLPGDTDVLYNLGMLYLETGAYDKSRSMFAKILKSDPKNIKALWGMGVVENTVAQSAGGAGRTHQGTKPGDPSR